MDTIEILEKMFELIEKVKILKNEQLRITTLYENTIVLTRELCEQTANENKIAEYKRAEIRLKQGIQQINSDTQQEYDRLKAEMERMQLLINTEN